MPAFLYAQSAWLVTCIQDEYLCLPMRVSLVLCFTSLVSRATFALGQQHCPELEQYEQHLGIPLLFLTEKSDGLILLIDLFFSLQSVRTDWEKGRGEVASGVIC